VSAVIDNTIFGLLSSADAAFFGAYACTVTAADGAVYGVNGYIERGKGPRPLPSGQIIDADITLTLIDEDQMVANKVESLRQEITKTRADAEMKVRLLEGKVQSLLAITHEAPTTEGL